MLSRFMSLKAMLPKESGYSPVMAHSRLNLSEPLRLSTQMIFPTQAVNKSRTAPVPRRNASRIPDRQVGLIFPGDGQRRQKAD